MGSDMLAGMGPRRVEGNNFSISVHPDSRQEADRMFTALAEGGSRGPILLGGAGNAFLRLTTR